MLVRFYLLRNISDVDKLRSNVQFLRKDGSESLQQEEWVQSLRVGAGFQDSKIPNSADG